MHRLMVRVFQPHIDQALGDLEMASKLSPGRMDSLERTAEVRYTAWLFITQ